MLVWLIATVFAATPVAGLSFTPLSRGDLVWVDDGRTTGLSVGEFDGIVRPALEPFGGVWFEHVGLFGSLGVARATANSTTEETTIQQHRGVVRPALDLRFRLNTPQLQRPAAWLGLGMYGDISSARFTSTGFTAEEQQAANEQATFDRARLGGVGGRIGGGVDLALRDSLWIGATTHLRLHRGTLLSGDTVATSAWLGSEAAITATFVWPAPPSAQD